MRQEMMGFWDAVASAGPYAGPTNSVRALKAVKIVKTMSVSADLQHSVVLIM